MLPGIAPRRVPLVRKTKPRHRYQGTTEMDFARGPAELAAAIAEKRPCRLSADFALHVNEIVLAMQNPGRMGCPYRVTSTFEPVKPMPWA
jgi:hypothetical protein